MAGNKRFSKIGDIKSWLKNIKSTFFSIFFLIRKRYRFRFIIYQAIEFLDIALVYPFLKVFLGKKKGFIISDSFKKIFVPSGILPLPFPLKSKIIIPAHTSLYFVPYFEIYIQDIYKMDTIKKGMCVVDVGANIGAYSVLAAEKVGESGKVVSVEPESTNYQRLVENIELNNFLNVIPKNIALADYIGSGRLFLHSSSLDHSLVFKESDSSFLEIPVMTLDGLLEEIGLENIDLLKIDAEGAEISVLKGAKRTLADNPNLKMIIAAGEHSFSEIGQVLSFLKDCGFQARVMGDGIVTNIKV